ncbi:MAG: hypothetical protein ACR2LQ_14325 [Acidimicrobiales bacterium]
MARSRYRWIFAVGVAVAVLAAPGCGGSTRSSPTPLSSSQTTTSAAPAPADAADAAEAGVRGLLLKAGEIGASFREAQLSAPTSTPLPCGQPDPRTVIVPKTEVVSLANDYLEGVGVAENLSVFADADAAQHVFTLLRDGYGCGQGSVAGAAEAPTTVKLSTPEDVTADIGAQEAFTVDIDTGSSLITTIAARVDEYVAVFQIGSNGRASANQLQLAKSGVAKIVRR